MLQAGEHLAQQMRHPAQRLPPADVHHPLPEYRGVDEAPAPKGAVDPREFVAKLAQRLVRYERDLAWADRHQAGIENIEMQALQIGHVSRNLEAQDLPVALAAELEPAGDAVED